MKRFFALAIVGVLALGAGSVAYANVCAFDAVPAATLLYPFVTYDYNDLTGNGTTTLFSVTNVSSEAQIVHVTVWTDQSVAILDYNVVLSGYDVYTQNIRDILRHGNLPVTATSGAFVVNGPTPTDFGPFDVPDFTLPDAESTAALDPVCNTGNPGAYAGVDLPVGLFESLLTETQFTDRLQLDCDSYSPYGLSQENWWQDGYTPNDPVWLYVTADVVQQCNLLFPDNPAYWAPDIASYDNVLMGDVFWLNDNERFSEADNAVHIEADVNLAQVATTDLEGDPYSFYYDYTGAEFVGLSDYREPLPTAWAFRYIGATSDAQDTWIRAWKNNNDFDGTTFGGLLAAFDCQAYTYYAWDNDENVLTGEDIPYSAPGVDIVRPNFLPLETQEVNVENFATPDDSGWMLFVWPRSNGMDFYPGTSVETFYETWMGVKYAAFGNYSAAMSGTVMANYNCFADQELPNLGINYDYVDEFGYTTGMMQVK